MPFYNYKCNNCDNEIEEFKTIKESEEAVKCNICNTEMKIQIGNVPVFFRGQGFSKKRIN